MFHVLLLLACAVAIYVACEWFVNAVEWLGVRLEVGPVAVGTILAAAGTALPESVVTLVAVLFGSHEHGNDIAVGAAMGGPLVVGTIAYGVTGGMLIWRKRQQRAALTAAASPRGARAAAPVGVGPDGSRSGPGPDSSGGLGGGSLALATDDRGDHPAGRNPSGDDLAGVDTARLARDQMWFLAIFAVKVGLGLVAFAVKPWLGLVFFAVYALYFRREMSAGGEQASDEGLEPLKIQRYRARPSTTAVAAQIVATLAVIFVASQLFVQQLEWAGPALGLPSAVVALLLSPVATELPEIMNAIIWVRQGKLQLALANISGAMMIQATVPSGIGLLFTAWKFDTPLVLAGVATAASIVYLLCILRARRLTAGKLAAATAFYVAFAVGLVLTL